MNGKSLYHSVKSIMEEREGKSVGSPLAGLLWTLSLPYGWGVEVKNFLYRARLLPPKRLPVPVISVGNLTVGGTGKTPVVIRIVEILVEMGIRPVVLSRGYRGEARGEANVVSDTTTVLLDGKTAGDEPFMMAKRLQGVPVMTGSSRFIVGMRAIKRFNPGAFILDDGFQHQRLHRDLNLLLIDSTNPFGNGYLFPRGILREPRSAVQRADLMIFTKCEEEHRTSNVPFFHGTQSCSLGITAASVVDIRSGEKRGVESLRNKKIAAFCGIGSPGSFLTTLKKTGCHVAGFRSFPDHHEFSQNDITLIRNEAREKGAEQIITTEKDAARISPELLTNLPVAYLAIDVTFIRGEEYLEKKNR